LLAKRLIIPQYAALIDYTYNKGEKVWLIAEYDKKD